MDRKTVVTRLLTVVFSGLALLSSFMASNRLNEVNAGLCDEDCGCFGGPKLCCTQGTIKCYTC